MAEASRDRSGWKGRKVWRIAGVLLLATAVPGSPAFAQISLVGDWAPRQHEDQPDRGPGPDLGDYLGIPINRRRAPLAESWDASRLTLQEHQCRVHVAPYIYHGPLNLRIWEEKDPETQQRRRDQELHQHLRAGAHDLDGRPAASARYAPHTFMGFSTGRWEGNILTSRRRT